MMDDQERVDDLLHTLQERAKELNCLYRVNELLNQPNTSDTETFRAIAESLPQGWQYPELCVSRIIYDGRVFCARPVEPSPWVQHAPIIVDGHEVGAVEVYYREHVPDADEGPFLKEERKLIDTVADWIGNAISNRNDATVKQRRGAPGGGCRRVAPLSTGRD